MNKIDNYFIKSNKNEFNENIIIPFTPQWFLKYELNDFKISTQYYTYINKLYIDNYINNINYLEPKDHTILTSTPYISFNKNNTYLFHCIYNFIYLAYFLSNNIYCYGKSELNQLISDYNKSPIYSSKNIRLRYSLYSIKWNPFSDIILDILPDRNKHINCINLRNGKVNQLHFKLKNDNEFIDDFTYLNENSMILSTNQSRVYLSDLRTCKTSWIIPVSSDYPIRHKTNVRLKNINILNDKNIISCCTNEGDCLLYDVRKTTYIIIFRTSAFSMLPRPSCVSKILLPQLCNRKISSFFNILKIYQYNSNQLLFIISGGWVIQVSLSDKSIMSIFAPEYLTNEIIQENHLTINHFSYAEFNKGLLLCSKFNKNELYQINYTDFLPSKKELLENVKIPNYSIINMNESFESITCSNDEKLLVYANYEHIKCKHI